MKLFQNPDGASHQSRAVLAYLSGRDAIEASWSDERKCYDACPEVSRWHNCREQGYVVTMRSKDYSRQLNVAFFEHRNSDEICAVEWEQVTINPPTIDTMDSKGMIYKNKYDTSFSVNFGKAREMADWIFERLTAFWISEEPRIKLTPQQ